MGYKLFCDRCGCEIRNADKSVKIDAEIKKIIECKKFGNIII